MSNKLQKSSSVGLPANMEDLSKYIVFTREKLNAVRAGIRAIDKLGVAKDVRELKMREAQYMATDLLDAETKMGELFSKLPKATPGKPHHKKFKNPTAGANKTKKEIIFDLGFNPKHADRFEALAKYLDIVEQVKVKAIETDDLPTRTAVLKQIRIIVNEKKRAEVKERLKAEELKTGKKKYRIVYADPPWMYEKGKVLSDKYGDVNKHYPPMETEDICNMPVADICEKDCVLFLWATAPKLPEALEVIKAWGFQYKTNIVWDKVKHNFGYYFSIRHEHLLIAGKGSSVPDVKKLHDSVIEIERTSKHSEKPEHFRQLIDELYTTGNRIELFARQRARGWDSYGNEIE